MNKPITAIVSLILCLCILASGVVPARGEEPEAQAPAYSAALAITTLEEFLSFAENCRLDSYSRGLRVSLNADIDLSGAEFDGIPIFSGTFEGNGHRVSGLNMTGEGSVVGLFRYLTETAVVRDLSIEGTVLPGGSRTVVGGLAGSNAGRIENCRFSGETAGGSSTGGLVGINTATGVLENCTSDGSVYGTHFVGGIAGENRGTIRSCENLARVNTSARQNSVELSDITMDTLVNSEAANTVTDVGGIAGSSSGVIRACVNRADVGYPHMGYNIGGIAGSQSGYIAGCENHGAVSGRKEVGGIVGHMEPLALVEFTEDTLQILEQQLGGLGAAVNQTSANAQNSSSEIRTHISSMEKQVSDAADALDVLIPDPGDPGLPDADSIQAAQNTLSGLLPGMQQSLQGIGSAAQGMVGTLARDMQALQGQISAMGATLSGASENLGGSITDVSDEDTDLDLTAKAERCANYGPVLGDLNVGGITGAMATENDLDPEDDLYVTGDSSMNFDTRLRCVALNCENTGEITAIKANAGGIVGWQSMGLVKDCRNLGDLAADAADYVGGISGMAAGYIRSCSTRCELAGSSYVGGIAGTAETVTDCRSMVRFSGGKEKLGAILGGGVPAETDGSSVLGNFYLYAGADPGAVDGISYAGQAQPLSMEEFLRLEGLEEMFKSVSVTFTAEDQVVKVLELPLGGSVSAEEIPAVPEKEGSEGFWEGLAEAELSRLYFDLVFRAGYTVHSTVLQSSAVDISGKPVLLVQGEFTPGAELSVTETADAPELQKGETLVESRNILLPQGENVAYGRYLVPEGEDPADLRLLVRGKDGSWSRQEFTPDGSYLVFSLAEGIDALALVRADKALWPYIIAGAGAAAVLIGLWLLARKKRRKKPDPKGNNE